MIVSTPIADVAKPYGDMVFIGDTPQEFLNACEQALAMTEEERDRRLFMMRTVLERTSWNKTATQMIMIIDEVLTNKMKAPRRPVAAVRRRPGGPSGQGPRLQRAQSSRLDDAAPNDKQVAGYLSVARLSESCT